MRETRMRRSLVVCLIALASCALLAEPAGGRTAAVRLPVVHGRMLAAASRPVILIPPPPGLRAQGATPFNLSSSNWAGYAAATDLATGVSGTVSDVTGTWVVPTVAGGAGDGYSADWIGIDGWTSPSVEQIGTEQDWVGGVPQYSAWWEMFPAAAHTIPTMTIRPGDVMSAEVRWVSGDTFTLSLTDTTTGARFTTQQTLGSTAARSSVEWIHEAPATSSGVLPLARTTPVTFTGCRATMGGTNGPIDDPLWSNTGVDMVQNNVLVAQASALDASGGGFTVAEPASAPPHISVSSTSLAFDYTQGGPVPPAKSFTFTNTGGGTLSWTAAPDATWLSCAPGAGGTGGSTAVSVSPIALAAGTYTGHIVVTAPGADNTPVSLPVTLNVFAASDVTPPTTSLHVAPVPNAAGWNDSDVAVGLTAGDAGGSGVASTLYTLDGVQHAYAATFTVSAEGVHALGYWSVDASGNVEPAHAATIEIDKTPPTLSLDATQTYRGSATIHASASDSLSGLDRVEMRIDAGAWSTANALATAAAGSHTVSARAFDRAGNELDVSASFTVVAPAPVGTATRLTGPASIRLGRTVTLSGTVAPSAAPGRVTIVKTRLFGGKWRSAGSATVTLARGTFSCRFKPTARGSWRFVAKYYGGNKGGTTYLGSRSNTRGASVR